MRGVSCFLGIALGLIAGGAVLVAGVFALLLLVPAVVWATREKVCPLGLGGLFIGLGSGSPVHRARQRAMCGLERLHAHSWRV